MTFGGCSLCAIVDIATYRLQVLEDIKLQDTARRRGSQEVGVVWCGVVWCGVVWCGVVWCGVVWCGVVWWVSHHGNERPR